MKIKNISRRRHGITGLESPIEPHEAVEIGEKLITPAVRNLIRAKVFEVDDEELMEEIMDGTPTARVPAAPQSSDDEEEEKEEENEEEDDEEDETPAKKPRKPRKSRKGKK